MSTEGTAPMNHDSEISPELAALNLADKPDGPGAAMMISAGFGVFVLGFLTVLAEASGGGKDWLASWEWGQGVGPLAGKTTVASLLYFVSLAVMWGMWRDKDFDLKKAFYIGMALGVLGVIGTFPTFFQMFAA